MNYLIFCGKLTPENEIRISPSNRCFRYGDGIFETIRCISGTPLRFSAHHQRMMKGITSLGMNASAIPSVSNLEEQIKQLGAMNNIADFIVRIQVFRENGGLFEDPDTQYIITCGPLPSPHNPKGISVCIYRDAVKSIDRFSNIKHCNYLPYLMAAKYARQSGKDDALLLNMHNRICDSSIANVFCIKGNEIRTPALKEGCVAGVYREWLIEVLKEKKFSLEETVITEQELLDSDEIFLTNAIRGIMPVFFINEISLKQNVTGKIMSAIGEEMPERIP